MPYVYPARLLGDMVRRWFGMTEDTPRVYVGAYALCVKDDRLLLVRLAPHVSDAGHWTLPGGGLDWGEAPSDGVLRELFEETGLSGRITRLAGIFSAQYPRSADRRHNSVHHLGILYDVETLPGEVRHEQAGSTDYCAWVPLAEIATLPLVALAEFGRQLLLNPASGRAG
jgi:ADP-ribose pyrophosphatase YjhB (NUDIX family)